MTLTEIIAAIVTGLSAIGGTGYFAWIFAKSKYLQEVERLKVEVLQAKKSAETTDIENGSKLIDLYKEALDDLEARHEKRYAHLDEMSKNIEKLFEQKEQILMKEIEYHKKQTELYKKMYNEKVKEFTKYKREHQ